MFHCIYSVGDNLEVMNKSMSKEVLAKGSPFLASSGISDLELSLDEEGHSKVKR